MEFHQTLHTDIHKMNIFIRIKKGLGANFVLELLPFVILNAFCL